jgi:hypothetical protein
MRSNALKGADGFNGIQRHGSMQLTTVQPQSSMPTESPGEVTTRATGRERLKVESMPWHEPRHHHATDRTFIFSTEH